MKRICFSTLLMLLIAGFGLHASWAAAPQPPEWGVLGDLVGKRWAVQRHGRPYVLSFQWLVPGRVMREDWRAAGDLVAIRPFVTKMEMAADGRTIAAKGVKGLTVKWEGVAADDGSFEFNAKSFLARGHRYRFIADGGAVLFEERLTRNGSVSMSPMRELDAESEARYLASVREAQVQQLQAKRQAQSEKWDRINQAMGAVNGALREVEQETSLQLAEQQALTRRAIAARLEADQRAAAQAPPAVSPAAGAVPSEAPSAAARPPQTPVKAAREMCSYPAFKAEVFDQAEAIEARIAKACGRASPTITRRDDCSLGWCKVWIDCSAWEAPCSGQGSAQ